MNACTIIARNYLAHARVLAESFLEHHPGGTFTTLILDDLDQGIDEASEPFRVLRPSDIGLDEAEFRRMALIYTVLELSTAVKPWLLRTLLEEGSDHVAYFDPDIWVLAPLDDVADLARQHGIVLTPHTTEPLPRDGLEPSETTILRAGMFNLGFIVVGAGSNAFLTWWAERLRRDCVVAPDDEHFVDQRWVDFVPALFDHYILRDVGCNVATWNLAARRVEWSGDRCLVNGVPLRFYHFSGFNPRTPHVLSKFQSRAPRILLSEHPAVARLCRDYAKELYEHGYESTSAVPYGFARLGNGRRINLTLRRAARTAIIDAQRSGDRPPPDPFDPAAVEAFLRWLGDRAAFDKWRGPGRYLRALYEVDPEAVPARFAHRVVMAQRNLRLAARERYGGRVRGLLRR